jgi:amino acid adenylation domain-containing protein
MLVGWNSPLEEYGEGMMLHELFEAEVFKYGESVAVAMEGEQLTYSELNSRANRVGRVLEREGAGREGLVAIYMPRSIEMIICILGVLKSGGAYVPIDPGYPRQRVAYVLEDSGASQVLTMHEMRWEIAEHGARVIEIDRQWDEIAEQRDDGVGVSATAENGAYVIYTSGSSGDPKGVVVTHQNVARLMRATESSFEFSEKDVWTMFHSYAFDFSVWEMWGALLNGGRLVVVPYWVSRSPEEFYELVSREGVTVLNQTPSAFRQFIVADGVKRKELRLRVVIFGGEALELASLGEWVSRHGDAEPQLVNMYGITETTVHVTYRRVMQRDVEQAKGSVIGRRITDLRMYVLDESLQPIPVGVTGEIYVSGEGLARGYLKRAALTAEKFIPAPYGEGGGRMYRSGDLGRYQESGEIEYLGRADQQVKVRGYRIELGEIEAVLMAHEGVREAVAAMREVEGAEKQLVAYVVSRGTVEIKASELREYLNERLPEYMVPAVIVSLDSIPLTTNGKVDRRALPEPRAARAHLEETRMAPESDAERTIAEIWQDVLGLDEVGVDDNFFDVGGDSINVIQVHARLREAFSRDVSIIEIFQYPTVRLIAAYLTRTEASQPAFQETQKRAEIRIGSTRRQRESRKLYGVVDRAASTSE